MPTRLPLLLPTRLLLLLGLAARAAAERVEAVVFLHDDDVHSFQDVSMALERLGLLPADALVITQEVRVCVAASWSKARSADRMLAPHSARLTTTALGSCPRARWPKRRRRFRCLWQRG